MRLGTCILVLLFAGFATLSAQEEHKTKANESGRSKPAAQPEHNRQGQPHPAGQQAQPARSNTPQGNPSSSGAARSSERQVHEGRPAASQGGGQANQPPASHVYQQGQGRTNQPSSQPSSNQPRHYGNQPAQQNQAPGTRPAGQVHPEGQRSTPVYGGAGAQGVRQTDRPGGASGAVTGRQQVVRYQNGQPHTVRLANGGMVRRSETGRVLEVRTPHGAVIQHMPSGARRVEMVRPGGQVVVATSRGRGYVQRPLVYSNRTFVQRTYVSGGRTYVNVYRPMSYHGVMFNVYTPVRFYRPAFYAWGYRPWARPVVFSWGWMGAPWYGYYRGYFMPYPTYASPVFWLTDFLISATLQAAYEDRMAAAAAAQYSYPPSAQPVLTPEVKQLIADEVRRQMEMDSAQAPGANSAAAYSGGANAPPPIFADNARHVFVASHSLLVASGAQQCALGDGDVIQTLGPPPMNSPTADAVVLAAQPQDCRRGAVVAVQLQDLQEMQNQMQETVDRGLADLQANGGQGRLPAPPPADLGTVDSPLASQIRPDSNVAAELNQASQEADQEEQAVVNQSANIEAGSAGPVTIALGQTIDQVTAIQGAPQKVVDLGARKIYVYPDMKITFVDGKVTDVQ